MPCFDRWRRNHRPLLTLDFVLVGRLIFAHSVAPRTTAAMNSRAGRRACPCRRAHERDTCNREKGSIGLHDVLAVLGITEAAALLIVIRATRGHYQYRRDRAFVEWRDETPCFYLTPLGANTEVIRPFLAGSHVYYVGSHQRMWLRSGVSALSGRR